MTVGILPVAGKATRIQGLPKYLLPVPGGYLLERMLSRMGVPCYIGANPENAALLDSYKRPEDHVYQVASQTMMETILTARPLVGDETVLMGMPDTYWTDPHVFAVLNHRIKRDDVICAVALFSVTPMQATRLGVCSFKFVGDIPYITSVINKSPDALNIPDVRVWGALAWTSAFWQYMQPEDSHPGIAIHRALDAGMPIGAFLASGDYYDNGIPDDYFRCIRELTGDHVYEGVGK